MIRVILSFDLEEKELEDIYRLSKDIYFIDFPKVEGKGIRKNKNGIPLFCHGSGISILFNSLNTLKELPYSTTLVINNAVDNINSINKLIKYINGLNDIKLTKVIYSSNKPQILTVFNRSLTPINLDLTCSKSISRVFFS
jgi:hypothetical protein